MPIVEKSVQAIKIKEEALNALKIEKEAIENLDKSINEDFIKAVNEILVCNGRIIMTGMGKSGLIARKISATLASTGTPSFYLHPAEALHGDLGMVTTNDILIALSNSGETQEILSIMPTIERIGAKIIAMTGCYNSTVAKNADYILNTAVKREACPLNLAPTASTTAALAMGDALAIALLKVREFKPEDFALYHPGGSLGKKLLLTVEDIVAIRNNNPVVKKDTTLKETLFSMTSIGIGAVSVVDEKGYLVGIITDGDIRRQLEVSNELLKRKAGEIMTKSPTKIQKDKLATKALSIMEEKEISDLPVVDEDGMTIGLINFQDLLKAGIL